VLVGRPADNHPQQTGRRGALDVVDDRRTPADLLDECAEIAGLDGFDLDAAATEASTKAPAFYSLADDGLRCAWWGRVWCNPPYSDCGAWVKKAHAEAHRCERIVMLLPANRTEQRWWQELVEPGRGDGSLVVRFLGGRRRFDRPGWVKPVKGDRPPFGLCVVVFAGGVA